MVSSALSFALLAGSAAASPFNLATRQTSVCPGVHVFGARETTASPGYGSAGTLVNNILSSNSGATAEAIDYPASGDNPSYADSRAAGVEAVNSQVASFASQCPDTKLVLVGYSQVCGTSTVVCEVLADLVK
jgi:acetylxylan esterase